jgi:hypothetical protein
MYIDQVKEARKYIIENDIKCSKCNLLLVVENNLCDRHKIELEEQIKKQMFREFCKEKGYRLCWGKAVTEFMNKEN